MPDILNLVCLIPIVSYVFHTYSMSWLINLVMVRYDILRYEESSSFVIRYSVTAITSRFHRGDRGSTPRIGVSCLIFTFMSIDIMLLVLIFGLLYDLIFLTSVCFICVFSSRNI